MASSEGRRPKSQHEPRVRDGLCRNLRSKGMLINIGERPENGSTLANYLTVDPNALAWDNTVWWCCETSKTLGPDDRPCHQERCVHGRDCYQAEEPDAPVA